jgi:hypothetical protein
VVPSAVVGYLPDKAFFRPESKYMAVLPVLGEHVLLFSLFSFSENWVAAV